MVRLVDRGGIAVADDARGDRPVVADIRICAGNPARTAHTDVVRSVVCAAGDCSAGAALSDLADPGRYNGAAAMAGYRGSERQGAALGGTARRTAAGDIRPRAADHAQLRLVRPQSARGADPLSAAGRSAGARLRL